VVGYEKVKVMVEEATKKNKEVATNRNGLGVELESKNSKARLGKIRVLVHANKMARP
jgi:hypothetical protein